MLSLKNSNTKYIISLLCMKYKLVVLHTVLYNILSKITSENGKPFRS